MSDEIPSIKIAHVFQPLLQPFRYKGAYGGRGSGKSHFFAGMAVALCLQKPGTRILCGREVQKSLRESVKLLIEDKIREYKVEENFKIQHDHIKAPGRGLIVFQGLQEHTKQSIKSFEGFDVAYLEEAHTITKGSLELLRPTIRKPGSQIWASWNPNSADDPIDVLLRGENPPPRSKTVEANWRDNPWFPDELEEERQYDMVYAADRYGHIWDGEYEPQVQGALWTRVNIKNNRMREPSALKRVVIGVDPPTSSEEGAAEAGIVAVGLGWDGNCYILADESDVYKPEQWARRVIALYDILDADAVVAEINQGGDMVKNTIQAVRPAIKVKTVFAKKGKALRAEPVSALYDLGRVHHIGTFPKLEKEMCLMNSDGYQGEGSPNRVDALVYGVIDLFGKLTRGKGSNKGAGRPGRTNSRAPADRSRARVVPGVPR